MNEEHSGYQVFHMQMDSAVFSLSRQEGCLDKEIAKTIGKRNMLSHNVGLKCAAGLVIPSSAPSCPWFYFAESTNYIVL